MWSALYLLMQRTEGKHLHVKGEAASLARTIRCDINLAIASLDYLLGDAQAETDPLLVHLRSADQFAELGEQFRDVFS